jgi:hypothetical protein
MSVKIIRTSEYPEEELSNMRVGDKLIWLCPDDIKNYGAFQYECILIDGRRCPISVPHLSPGILLYG